MAWGRSSNLRQYARINLNRQKINERLTHSGASTRQFSPRGSLCSASYEQYKQSTKQMNVG